MKSLLIGALLIMATAVSCVKANQTNTKYTIEAEASNIENVYYQTKDHGTIEVEDYNESSFKLDWKGHKVNDISVSINCTGTGTIKIYKKGEVVAQQSGEGTVNLNYKN